MNPEAKRKAAVLIGEGLLREVQRGGRMTLYVDLDVSGGTGSSRHHRMHVWKTEPGRKSGGNRWWNY